MIVCVYSFSSTWLLRKFNRKDKIDQRRSELAISKSEENILLGILKHDVSKPGYQHVTAPSKKDLTFLSKLYGMMLLSYDQQTV